MGNSESVIVPRHERKHRSGRWSSISIVPNDQEHHHHRRRRHHSSSGSDTSSKRSRRVGRLQESESSSGTHVKRPSGVRYSQDYSDRRHGYVIDGGYVEPGIHLDSRLQAQAKVDREVFKPCSTGAGYSSAIPQQRRMQAQNRGGSYIPQPWQTSFLLHREESPRPRPEQWSRRPHIGSYN